jgi:hypothetical protein
LKKVKKNYKDFSSVELAMELSFCNWITQSDATDVAFWNKWCFENPDKNEDIEAATNLVRLIMMNKNDEIISKTEIDKEWERLSISNKPKLKPKNNMNKPKDFDGHILNVAAICLFVITTLLNIN